MQSLSSFSPVSALRPFFIRVTLSHCHTMSPHPGLPPSGSKSFIPLRAHPSLLHFSTAKLDSGGSRIDESSPPPNAQHCRHHVSPSPWIASASGVDVRIRLSQSGQHPRMLCQRNRHQRYVPVAFPPLRHLISHLFAPKAQVSDSKACFHP
jgi:hypothetical protein